MKLWRISNYADLAGNGGLKTAGRWHNKGIPIVYLAEHPALALLETLVHFGMAPDDMPVEYQLLEVECDDSKGILELDKTVLGENWITDLALTRQIGDQWLTSSASVLLKVPSAIMPYSHNYLLNPKHDLAKGCTIVSCHRYPFDQRNP